MPETKNNGNNVWLRDIPSMTNCDLGKWKEVSYEDYLKTVQGEKDPNGLNSQGRKTVEKDPFGLGSKEPGSKLDAGKVSLLRGCIQYFPRALLAVAQVSEVGANKYSWRGWESVVNGVDRYGDALARHLAAEATEGPYDGDTKCLHAAQVCWNSLARLELILREKENAVPKT